MSSKKRAYVPRVKINLGDRFGRLTIVKEVERRNGLRHFLCECSCIAKTRKVIRMSSLTTGHTNSCGCLKIERATDKEDVIGNIYGRITVISDVISENKLRRVMGQCSCDGNIKEYWLSGLKNGHATSCGCLKIGKIIEANTNQTKDYQEKHPLFCKVEEIMDDPDGYGILVRCKHSECRKWFKPTKNALWSRIGVIENPGIWSIGTENNFYCSDKCKDNCILYNLHSGSVLYNNVYREKVISDNIPTGYELSIWSDEVLKQQRNEYGYNFCTKCQGTENLASHHIDPKKIEPFYALDPDNGIVFCRDCHVGSGHSGGCSMGALAHKVCK